MRCVTFIVPIASYNMESKRHRTQLCIEYVHLGRVVVHDLESLDVHAQSTLSEKGETDLRANKE